MRVAVVGGGAVGLFCAHYLAKDGHEVTVIDQGSPVSERCSSGNLGYLVPSHFVPLASPGALGLGLRAILEPAGPLRIKPTFDPGVLRWMLQFARSSTRRNVDQAGPVLHRLCQASVNLHDEFAADRGLEIRREGLLLVCASEQTLDHEVAVASAGRDLGIRSEILDVDKLKQIDPGIEYRAAGALYYPDDRSLNPAELLGALVQSLQALGVRLAWDTKVRSLSIKDGKAVGVETSGSRVDADAVVIAAGAWSPALARTAGVNLAVQAGKGYSMTISRPPVHPRVPSLLIEGRIGLAPLSDGLRLGGTMEFGGIDLDVNPRRVQAIVESARRFVPALVGVFDSAPIWKGLRPCSPDGLPFVGPFKRVPNLLAATGHAMLGITLAPITGTLIASHVRGENPEDSEALRPDRFR